MYSIEDVNEILDEIAEKLPEEVFQKLNGGVSLLPGVKYSEAVPNSGLYTLGEYRYDQMGRYIVLYYGSIRAVHGRESREELYSSLDRLLKHELTHPLESLSGERDLEIDDKRRLSEFLRDSK